MTSSTRHARDWCLTQSDGANHSPWVSQSAGTGLRLLVLADCRTRKTSEQHDSLVMMLNSASLSFHLIICFTSYSRYVPALNKDGQKMSVVAKYPLPLYFHCGLRTDHNGMKFCFVYRASTGLLHCASAVAQCIVIGPVCGCVCVCLWVCYQDNSKLHASILTKLDL